MIVEDQALIGMSLEASLEEAGFNVEGPFMSNAQALHRLESDTPDIALLDIMIKDGTSIEIARTLKDRGVPFAVYSGLPPKEDGPPELQNVLWLEKPISRETLMATLNELAQRQQQVPVDNGKSVDSGRSFAQIQRHV
ncbi:response regulator [Microvirga solisilvae]|uniref:response regulator n=1 Tax=Microvirga solisilvae TaxID=2919498 RepID=UPI001FAEC406|nr:response regulator [Microvirga solisilvae]